MAFCFTWVACMKPDGNQPIQRVLEVGSIANYFTGDYYYNDSGSTQSLNGVDFVPTVYGPTGNNTQLRNTQRFTAIYGRAGHAAWQEFWRAKDAGQIRCYSMPDDHDGCWNNNDHSLAVFKDKFNVAAGTLSGMLDAAVTQTDVLTNWRLGQTSLAVIQAAYFDNVWGSANGDIPSAMAGVATAADYAVKYTYHDYSISGALNTGGLAVRVILPDCVSYKDPAANTDTTGKTMLGVTQLAWIKARITEATQAGAKHIVMLWTKDLFNLDNGDGGAGYKTEIDALMQWIHDNNHAVLHGTGDRHAPHASQARVASGDAYDASVVCACPFGQGPSNLTQYNRNVWALGQNDGCVYGLVEVDEIEGSTTMSIMDAFANQPVYSATFPWGSRLPSKVASAHTNAFKPSANPLRTAPSVPATNVYYYNTLNVPISLIIGGGTVTVITFSRDAGTTEDIIPAPTGGGNALAGTFYLAPGDGIKITYSVAPTKFVQYPLG